MTRDIWVIGAAGPHRQHHPHPHKVQTGYLRRVQKPGMGPEQAISLKLTAFQLARGKLPIAEMRKP